MMFSSSNLTRHDVTCDKTLLKTDLDASGCVRVSLNEFEKEVATLC